MTLPARRAGPENSHHKDMENTGEENGLESCFVGTICFHLHSTRLEPCFFGTICFHLRHLRNLRLNSLVPASRAMYSLSLW